MIKINRLPLLFILVIIVACGKKATPTTTKYDENIESYRPKYDIGSSKPETTLTVPIPNGAPKEHDNKIVEEKLSLIREKNKGIKYTQGFKIQVYSGSNREAAEKARENIYRIDPDLDPEVIYFPPNFKVKVGNYYDRLEAHAALTKLRETFPQALLIPERVNIK